MSANNGSIKTTLLIIITFIFLVISGLILFFQYFEAVRDQNNTTDEILTKISYELNKKSLKDSTISSLKADLFYAIWVRTDKSKWIPVIYDKDNFYHYSDNPADINKNLIYNVRLYEKSIGKYGYIVWLNRFDMTFYIKNILIPFIFLLFVYFIVILIVTLLFKNPVYYENEEVEEKNFDINNKRFEEEPDTIIDEFKEDENISQKSSTKNEIISDYKELWIKHFKVSDNFKLEFPFNRIYNLIKFGVKPEDYIYEGLIIASDFFRWQNPRIYILQGNVYIESITKEILTENIVEIPLKGDKKGEIFIPLFPYNSHDIFGYLNFVWNKDNNFYIADILYFLKFMFSEEAKSIFLDYKRQENILTDIKSKLEKTNNEVLISFFVADNKEKLMNQLQYFQQTKIENDIYSKIQNDFKNYFIFKARPFCFGLIGEKVDKIKDMAIIEKWILDENKHNYSVSNDYGNIALTFSCGISSKNNRNISAENLVIEAEINMKDARELGGNQVVSS